LWEREEVGLGRGREEDVEVGGWVGGVLEEGGAGWKREAEGGGRFRIVVVSGFLCEPGV